MQIKDIIVKCIKVKIYTRRMHYIRLFYILLGFIVTPFFILNLMFPGTKGAMVLLKLFSCPTIHCVSLI